MTERQRSPRQHYKTVYETRTFLSFQVREEALQAVLPPGWSLAASDDGADRGSNVRFGFSDQLAATDPSGSPMEVTRFCPVTVPARRGGPSELVRRIAIAYWSNARFTEPMRFADLPKAYTPGRTPDSVETDRELHVGGAGEPRSRQRWLFTNAGQGVSAEIEWSAGHHTRGREEFWVMSPALDNSYRQYVIEKVEEVVMSRPLAVDRLLSLKFRASGKTLSTLFDGSETLVSVVVQSFGRREIYLY